MKVDPDGPCHPHHCHECGWTVDTGIPIRLELAKAFTEAWIIADAEGTMSNAQMAKAGLETADELLRQYNAEEEAVNHDRQ